MYTGASIVDYLSSTGQKSDYASRAQLAASKGITNYTGSAEQNTTLLNMLRSGSPNPQPQPQPQAPKPQAQPTYSTPPSQTSAGGVGSGGLVEALIAKGYNPTDAQNAANGPRAAELAREYLGAGGGSVTGSMFTQPTIDLPGLYKSLTESSGISGLETQLIDQTKAFNAAVSKINDNPFLSEANRVGRIQKLQTDFNNATATTREQIAMKKADVETQLNLQSKQFDIQSQQAQQALAQYNALLDSGALDNATGEDIANITRATGLSGSLIQSAIQAKKISNYKTTTESFDDGREEGFIIYTIDPMGNIVNQTRQVTGQSKKSQVSYSTDPMVSNFISKFMRNNGNSSDISSLWED